MKHLLAPILLLVFLFPSLTGCDAEVTVASNATRCSAVYLIATSAYAANKSAAENMVAIQEVFDDLYLVNESARSQKTITNGMILKVKSDVAVQLGREYDRNPETIYALEMRCNLWKEQIIKLLTDAERNGVDIRSTLLSAPDLPSSPVSSDPRWSRSEIFVDNALSAWTKMGRVTPYEMRQKLKRELRK